MKKTHVKESAMNILMQDYDIGEKIWQKYDRRNDIINELNP